MASKLHIQSLLDLGRISTPLTIEKLDTLHTSLVKHEGLRLKMYPDITGHITIGVGHNLTDNGITLATAEHILSEDITKAMQECSQLLPWTQTLDDVRKRAFVELMFNMGRGLLAFHKALQAAQTGDWSTCVSEFKSSLWSKQVGSIRASDIEQMLLTGTDPTQ